LFGEEKVEKGDEAGCMKPQYKPPTGFKENIKKYNVLPSNDL